MALSTQEAQPRGDGNALPDCGDGVAELAEAVEELALRDGNRARPSSAPAPAQDAAQVWGRAGHLTDAQASHLAAMQRACPCSEEEVRRRTAQALHLLG
jgi:hypothetical protein